MIRNASVPKLAPDVELRYDEARERWILMGPEGVMLPDETALAILQRINGTVTVVSIAQALAKEYDADPEGIAVDVRRMLQDLADRGFLHT